jgi:hypothetical protein
MTRHTGRSLIALLVGVGLGSILIMRSGWFSQSAHATLMGQFHSQMDGTGCPNEVLPWLSTIPKELRQCGPGSPNLNVGGMGPVDVNCDGEIEVLESSTQFEPVYAGQTQDIPSLIFWNHTSMVDGEPMLQRQPVFRPGTSVGDAFRSAYPSAQHVRVYLLGWIDADLDGDLDLIAWVYVDSWGQNFYFENIGYEKPGPPLAADINRDGRVDGADLGLVLVSWGPNP